MDGVTTINEPVDARILLAIAVWHDHDPSESVTAFCTKHDVSRSSLLHVACPGFVTRDRTYCWRHGHADRRPQDYAVAVHKAIVASGWDHAADQCK